jgi:hypothetical protein
MMRNPGIQFLFTSFVAVLISSAGLQLTYAGPCSADIDEIEAAMGQSEPGAGANSDGNANLAGKQAPPHAQPRAELRSDPRYIAAMERARTLDSQNGPGCIKLVREIKNLIGM